MKKQYFVIPIFLALIFALFFYTKAEVLFPSVPFEINTPTSLSIDKMLDPYANLNPDSFYYVSDDKGYFDLEIENKFDTKSISHFNSSAYKNMLAVKRSVLLKDLSDADVVTTYYLPKGVVDIDRSDVCASIIKSREGQNYIIGIPPQLCQPFTKK